MAHFLASESGLACSFARLLRWFARPLRPSCVASAMHKSLRWLVCSLVERPLSKPNTPFNPGTTNIARSFGLPGLAPYWPHATRRRAANTHTQAACNSVIDNPLVRRVPISLSPFLPRDLRLSLRLQTQSTQTPLAAHSKILRPATFPRRDLGPISRLPTLRLTAGLVDSESALRLRLRVRRTSRSSSHRSSVTAPIGRRGSDWNLEPISR